MEFEDVSEKMDWEARRVAAAFGVETVESVDEGLRTYQAYQCDLGFALVWWAVDAEALTFQYIAIGDGNEDAMRLDSWTINHDIHWDFCPQPQFHQLMARGLYRLGFEDDSVLSQLPELSAHEQLELRLSMPREFWPKKWLEEREPLKIQS